MDLNEYEAMDPDEQSLISDQEREQVLGECRALDEMELAADCLSRGVDPREIRPRMNTLERVCRAGNGVGETAEEVSVATQHALEGFSEGDRVAKTLAAYRDQVLEFEGAIAEAQLFTNNDRRRTDG